MDDLALLHHYARGGAEAAFTAVVRRYVDLVHATALRQVRSPDLAADVTQRVFLELSASIGRLRADTHLAAWLFVVTRRTAIDTVRRETSRQRREQSAAEVAAMKAEPPLWVGLSPQLDEAVSSLPERDRQVIQLRFFEDRSLAEIGAAIGASENAAQKRLSRALAELQRLLARRGITVTAAGLATEITLHAAEPAPAALAGRIATDFYSQFAALPAGTFATASGAASGLLPKALVAVGLAAAVVGLVFQARHNREAEAHRVLLTAAIRELDGQLARAAAVPAPTTLPARAAGSIAANPLVDARLAALLVRVTQLRQRFEAYPQQRVPELALLKMEDWIAAAQEFTQLESDTDFAVALSSLRSSAKGKFGQWLYDGLKAFAAAHADALPTDLAQLAAHFPASIDPSVFRRYELLVQGSYKAVPFLTKLVVEKADEVIDPSRDHLVELTSRGGVSLGPVPIPQKATNNGQTPTPAQMAAAAEVEKAITAAQDAYSRDHNGRRPSNGEQLRPYFTDPVLHEHAAEISFEYISSDPFSILDETALSGPQAIDNAVRLFRADHHGAHPNTPEDIAPYFQDPIDAAKYILAAREIQPPAPVVPTR